MRHQGYLRSLVAGVLVLVLGAAASTSLAQFTSGLTDGWSRPASPWADRQQSGSYVGADWCLTPYLWTIGLPHHHRGPETPYTPWLDGYEARCREAWEGLPRHHTPRPPDEDAWARPRYRWRPPGDRDRSIPTSPLRDVWDRPSYGPWYSDG